MNRNPSLNAPGNPGGRCSRPDLRKQMSHATTRWDQELLSVVLVICVGPQTRPGPAWGTGVLSPVLKQLLIVGSWRCRSQGELTEPRLLHLQKGLNRPRPVCAGIASPKTASADGGPTLPARLGAPPHLLYSRGGGVFITCNHVCCCGGVHMAGRRRHSRRLERGRPLAKSWEPKRWMRRAGDNGVRGEHSVGGAIMFSRARWSLIKEPSTARALNGWPRLSAIRR
jgi:hypothetical protein